MLSPEKLDDVGSRGLHFHLAPSRQGWGGDACEERPEPSAWHIPPSRLHPPPPVPHHHFIFIICLPGP